MPIETPQTKAEAQVLCERYAELASEVALQETARDTAIAEINASTDKALEPLIVEQSSIEAAIKPYFFANRFELLSGKAKSLELGGCILGSRLSPAKVGVAGKAADVAARLVKLDWAKDAYVSTKISLDVKAIAKGLISKDDKAKLRRQGLSIIPSEEAFFIKRTEQGRTSAKAG